MFCSLEKKYSGGLLFILNLLSLLMKIIVKLQWKFEKFQLKKNCFSVAEKTGWTFCNTCSRVEVLDTFPRIFGHIFGMPRLLWTNLGMSRLSRPKLGISRHPRPQWSVAVFATKTEMTRPKYCYPNSAANFATNADAARTTRCWHEWGTSTRVVLYLSIKLLISLQKLTVHWVYVFFAKLAK